MTLMDSLEPGEEVMARAGPFYATSRRVLRYEERLRTSASLPQLPYTRLKSIELVHPPNHRKMIGGVLVAFGGLFATFYFGMFTTILLVPLGIGLIGFGAMGNGNQPYYQLHVLSATAKELALWRVPYRGSMDFLSVIGSRTGYRPIQGTNDLPWD